MVKLRSFLPGIFTAALLAGFAWLVLRPHEPVYQGKTLIVWLQETYEAGGDTKAEERAEEAIRALGAEALPVLVEGVRGQSSVFRAIVNDLGRDKSMHFLHLPPQDGLRQKVVWAFNILGARAKPAVPELARLLDPKDHDVAVTAVKCLGNIGPEARDAVREMVRLYELAPKGQRGEELRYWTALALADVGPVAQLAIPVLSATTNSPAAEFALIKIRGDSFLPYIESLKDTSNEARWNQRAMLVSRIGTNTEVVVPLLVAGLQTTNKSLHATALRALGQIHSQPEICIPAMIPFLKSTNVFVRRTSLEGLRSFGMAARPAVPEILGCLKDADYSVQLQAANALRAIEPQALAKKEGAKP
ncbi:HEAT repeat domain-containing protein [Pedosphaera parvula]|uniref:PBS lyase HEAT domain protein repeat-containing protein n=1 Tax=Pedosphaera parvula (strain Ellin514) TaxID=320771 RepID=B9XPX4_PEDPL|nr:HEAT repeat domain-containing protein [Pedosphaera parvula]EEF58071.1 hypothetical protein Cflav_PD1310 [Pedosphaera parvula Ellin514]